MGKKDNRRTRKVLRLKGQRKKKERLLRKKTAAMAKSGNAGTAAVAAKKPVSATAMPVAKAPAAPKK